MATDVVMPQMGADMEEGTLLRWIKHPGDHVARGEVIAEIETDKANVEIESFEEGVLTETLAEEGQVVPVGQPIARIGAAGEARDGATAGAPSANGGATRQSTDGAMSGARQTVEAGAQTAASEARVATAAPAVASPPQKQTAPLSGQPVADGSKRSPAHAAQASTSVVEPQQPTKPVTPQADAGELEAAAGGDGERFRVSPVARHLAEELGVDVRGLKGSGPDGRVMRKDVEAAAAAAGVQPREGDTAPRSWSRELPEDTSAAEASPEAERAVAQSVPSAVSETLAPTAVQPTAPRPTVPETREERPAGPREASQPARTEQPATPSRPAQPAAATTGVQPLSRMRQAIARRMAQSKREAPHYYVTAEVDMTEAMAFRTSLNEASGDAVHVTVNDLIVKACAEVLQRFPHFNAAYTEAGLRLNERINICIAVALPDGLIAPALLDVGVKSLGAIAREGHDLGERARNGGLRGPELSDGTFTISNLGMYGIETLIPIIQPPQAAILGVGAVQDKPAVHEGQIVIRKLMMVALAADHRVTDGAQGGEFLREIKRTLEHPVALAL